MASDIARALQDITNPGSYSSRFTSNSDHLDLEVKGVGSIKLPISATTAKALIKQARQAPFGWRDKTVLYTNIRNVWEFAKSKVKIDKREWNKTLYPALEKLRAALGLPDGKLKADLYKMLVYEKGQFFVPHQDSEKTDNMVATLVVVLPSAHQGGRLVVSHHGEKKTTISKAGI